MVKIIFLGTNGWYDSETGNTISILVQTDLVDVVFDAGYGVAKLDRYVGSGRKPVILFLSHYHLDHIVGLHTLFKCRLRAGLTMVIPRGTRDTLRTIMAPPFTAHFSELPYPAHVVELPGEEHALSPLLAVEASPLHHVTQTLGYRIGIAGVTLAYVPDTGYCANALHLARNAHVLLAECAYAPGLSSDAWPHLNPETAARIAAEANAKALYLVHFDAAQYPHLSHRDVAEEKARLIFPHSRAARDGMECIITEDDALP